MRFNRRVHKTTLTINVLCVVKLISFSMSVQAEQLTLRDRKEFYIQELLDVAGIDEIAQLLTNPMSTELLTVLRKKRPQLSTKEHDFMKREIKKVVNEHVRTDHLRNHISPIYHKYYTINDLRTLIAFYSTPTGQQFTKTEPEIGQAIVRTGAEWKKILLDKLQKRFKQIEKRILAGRKCR